MRAQAEDPGYAADNLMIVRIELPRTAYADGASWARFFNEASARLKTLPGVVRHGASMDFFMRRNGDQNVTTEGRIADPNAPRQRLTMKASRRADFDVAGIELVEGRMFDERDLAPGAAPVFIVNELMARQLWPGESAVGKRMVNGRQPRKDGRWDTVVGVVRSVHPRGPRSATVSHCLHSDQSAQLRLGDSRHDRCGRTDSHGAPRAARRGPIHSAHADHHRSQQPLGAPFGPAFSVTGPRALRRDCARARGSRPLCAARLSGDDAHTRNWHPVGAGADRRSIVTMVLRHGVRLAVAGVLAGIVVAASVAGLLQSLLYNTQAIEASSYASAAIGMLLVAVTAACVPALRAARVNPMRALREG